MVTRSKKGNIDDTNNNPNNDNDWEYDTTPPTMTITPTPNVNGKPSNKGMVVLTFNSNDETTNFLETIVQLQTILKPYTTTYKPLIT